jgi:hypothetical protein
VNILLPVLLLALAVDFAPDLAVDLNDRPITRLAPPEARAVVLFFAASDCPISNRYVPEMKRLAEQSAPLGVQVWFVYPNPGDNAQVVRAHNKQFAITDHTALDTEQNLMRMAHATVTPEAAIFVPRADGLREVYRGRIDDRYVSFGKEHPQATHHDLEAALQAVLAGKPVPKPGGPPVGCSIVSR